MAEFEPNSAVRLLTEEDGEAEVIQDLLLRGFSMVDLSLYDCGGKDGVDVSIFSTWEQCFRAAFELHVRNDTSPL